MKVTAKKLKVYIKSKLYLFGTEVRVFFARIISLFLKKSERKYYVMNARRAAMQRRDIKGLKGEFRKYLVNVKKIKDETEIKRLTRDCVKCFKKYGIEIKEYFSLKYISLSAKDRDKIVSIWRQYHVVKSLNPPEYRYMIDDKKVFTQTFRDFTNRVSLYLKACDYKDFETLFNTNEMIVIKPTNLCGGEGIYMLDTKKKDPKSIFNDLIGKDLLAEEYIKQTGVLHDICPTCVNTVRIATLNDNGDVSIFFAFLRTGKVGAVVDNYHAGGLTWPINHHTGEVVGFGRGEDCVDWIFHPDTKIKVQGLILPHWEEACEICKRIARQVPELSYISWDVVISEDKISIIEGNCNGGIGRQYSPDYDMWKFVREFMDKKLGDKRPMSYF